MPDRSNSAASEVIRTWFGSRVVWAKQPSVGRGETAECVAQNSCEIAGASDCLLVTAMARRDWTRCQSDRSGGGASEGDAFVVESVRPPVGALRLTRRARRFRRPTEQAHSGLARRARHQAERPRRRLERSDQDCPHQPSLGSDGVGTWVQTRRPRPVSLRPTCNLGPSPASTSRHPGS